MSLFKQGLFSHDDRIILNLQIPTEVSIQSHAVYDRVIFVYLLLYQDMADFVLRYMDIFYTRHTSSWYIEHLITLHGFIHVLMHP